MGADYDLDATPGLAETGNDFIVSLVQKNCREILPSFTKGHTIVGVCGAPFKCPPAPSEAALLLHDHLTKLGVREACTISLVMPFGLPIPPSPGTSKALLKGIPAKNIQFIAQRKVHSLAASGRVVMLDDGTELPCDLFLGILKHVAQRWYYQSGLAETVGYQ